MPRRIDPAVATDPSDPYHHGELRPALVRAADEILAASGMAGFSLRAVARRAGVSPAAPAHHFGNASGLFSEVAAMGFESLASALEAVSDPALTPTQRLRAQGQAYVHFTLAYPGRFQLMFRRDLLENDHVKLCAAGARALASLETTIRAMHGRASSDTLDREANAALLAAWSAVHGFAHLALGGKLTIVSGHGDNNDLLDGALADVLSALWPD